MRRVAVIGSGIAGLAAARMLGSDAQVTLFEAAAWFGGHTHTVDLTLDGVTHGVDTGFLVFNDKTYPKLVRLLADLGVETADGSVEVTTDSGIESFGSVVMACHSDQSLALLADASAAERETLGAIRFHANRAVLHTDASVLPRRRRAWAAWNYERADFRQREGTGVCLHYLINRLQPLPFGRPVIVSLNPIEEPVAGTVHGDFHYTQCADVPSGRHTSSDPCSILASKAKTARAAEGRRGAGPARAFPVNVVMGTKGSTGHEGLRRGGLSDERHALQPKFQCLPANAGDDAERQQRNRHERLANALPGQRLEHSRDTCLEEHAGHVVVVDPRHGSRRSVTRSAIG